MAFWLHYNVIELRYDNQCVRDWSTGRWLVPTTVDVWTLVSHFNWPFMLHDEPLSRHVHNIIGCVPVYYVPVYYMDEACSSHFDRHP